VAFASLGAWVVLGQYAFAADWADRRARHIAANPHWVLISSWWMANESVRMRDPFPSADLADFEPVGLRTPSASSVLRHIATGPRAPRFAESRRPPNVILVVLESVAARWTSLNGGVYDTTPMLQAEAKRGIVFNDFYAHIGRSSNSLAAILLSSYPKLGYREFTEEFTSLPKTSLSALLQERGYRTAFVTPSDLTWAGWRTFLEGRGFDELRDHHGLSCTEPISSWGVEDRCMVDGVVQFIKRDANRPFFVMAWTTQTHHPYEPTPGIPVIDLWQKREPMLNGYDLTRYLAVLHETDRQLGRLFDAVRRAGLEDDTIIVVTGDHGQAFGYPHDTYGHGRTVYEEDVRVPLFFWYPRLYRDGARASSVGSHVDLAPTIAELAGLPPAPDWQGRSLFDDSHSGRAYFYVADDEFTLGIREDNWKYIFSLRGGGQELYDLERDPNEQQNLASSQPERCDRMRQRLAAWTEANRRQYGRASKVGS
jgi:arylsulfatase A-like enzyme